MSPLRFYPPPSTAATMNDLDSLLQAVCDFPAEDTPRLMYADALQERDWKGDKERGEFIRIQVGLANLGYPGPLSVRTAVLKVTSGHLPSPGSPAALAHRCAEMMHAHIAEWLPDAFIFGEPVHAGEWAMSRGFLQKITVTVENFLAYAADIFRLHPVEKVTLVGREPSQVNPSYDEKPWFWSRVIGGAVETIARFIPDRIALCGDQDALEGRMTTLYSFATQQDALNWVSDACCAFGRAEARKRRLEAAVAT